MRKIATAFLRSDGPLGGLGEPCVPPLAPALANAIYAACGIRVRQLPIRNTPLSAICAARVPRIRSISS